MPPGLPPSAPDYDAAPAADLTAQIVQIAEANAAATWRAALALPCPYRTRNDRWPWYLKRTGSVKPRSGAA